MTCNNSLTKNNQTTWNNFLTKNNQPYKPQTTPARVYFNNVSEKSLNQDQQYNNTKFR